MSDWKEAVKRILPAEQILFEESMRHHTTFRIGGPAEVFAIPKTEEELIQLIKLARERDVAWYVVGNGSNLLVSDEGLRGLVITTTALLQDEPITREGNILTATAGVLLSRLARFACDNELGGLAFAHGIPGTLGAAIAINAGAYDGEMKDVIKTVTYLDEEGICRTLSEDELGFGYRTSCFCGTERIILSATMELSPCPRDVIVKEMSDLNQRRRDKQPLELPSAGSAFKRPVGGFAAKLIDECGLRGYRIGDAQVSEKHTGFVVNLGNATAEDVKKLLYEVQKRVEEKTGIVLEPEIRFMT